MCPVVNDWWLTSLDWAVQILPEPTQKASFCLRIQRPSFLSSHLPQPRHPAPSSATFSSELHLAHSLTRSIRLINPLDIKPWTCCIYPVDLSYPGAALAYRTNQHNPFAYPPTLSHAFLPICLTLVLAAQRRQAISPGRSKLLYIPHCQDVLTLR